MDDNTIALFKEIELLDSLSDEELREISFAFVIKKVNRNELVLHEEDTNNVMYMVLSGELKVVQASASGNEIILAIHDSGQFFGEISLIDGKTSPATVISSKESVIALISKQDFFGLIGKHGKIRDKLLQIMCIRLRDSWEKIRMLTMKDPAERIKALFLGLCHGSENNGSQGTVLKVKLTHQDIADMTGLTRETVTRILKKWQNSGKITILEKRYIRLNSEFMT
jgi:CRP/FNR family transcriptional regulator